MKRTKRNWKIADQPFKSNHCIIQKPGHWFVDQFLSLREKWPYSEFFQSVFSRIRTEYTVFTYPVNIRIQSKCGKIRTRSTNKSTFYAVYIMKRLALNRLNVTSANNSYCLMWTSFKTWWTNFYSKIKITLKWN